MSRLSSIAIALVVAACAEPTRPSEEIGAGPLFSTTTSAGKVEVCPGDDDAYPTVAAALAAVPPGGTVEICPGTYADMLVIDKSVTIEGSRKGTVTLAPPPALTDRAVWFTTSDPVVITDLTIDFAGTYRILSVGRFDLTARRVVVLRAGQPVTLFNHAPSTGGRARLVLEDGIFDGGSPARSVVGPYFGGDVDAVVKGNIVRRTTFSCIQVQAGENTLGVPHTGVPKVQLIDNDVDECGVFGGLRLNPQGGGFAVMDVVGNTVRNTTRSDSRFGIIFGFGQVSGAPTSLIEGNTVVDYVQSTADVPQAAAGITITGAAAPVVRFNDIAGNAHAGLRATTTATIDARCNWWGATNGPSGNGSGSGDAVVGTVTFVPFATAPVAGNRPPGCRGVD